MKTIEERRRLFLDKTVEYYGEDLSRRAINEDDSCYYRASDGKKCAIGRHIPDDKYSEDIEGNFVKAIFNLLPSEIQEFGTKFLSNVQMLHDENEYWNYKEGKGLSERGKQKYDYIIKRYCK